MINITLNDILPEDVQSVSPNTPLVHVLASMQAHAVSSVVVAEDRYPQGIFTMRDAVMLASRREKLFELNVSDVMSAPLVTVNPDAELKDAYQVMAGQNIRHLVVVDRSGLLVGIVSKEDFAAQIDPGYDSQLDRVEAVMAPNVCIATAQDTLATGIRRMADRCLDCIVVGSPDRAEGILTERDIARLLLSETDLAETQLGAVMHRPDHSIRQSDSLRIARERMSSHGVSRLQVTDDTGDWRGLIALQDLLRGLEQSYWQVLQQNEAHFRSLYEHAPLPYQSLDENGCLLAVNRAWEETLGYSREQAIGRYIGDFHVPGQEEKFKRILADFFENGSMDVVIDFVCCDGSHKIMSATGQVASYAGGRIQRTHCILSDITERARVERELRESERRFREVLEHIEDVFWMTDPETSQIIYINSAYESQWGGSREELYKNPRSFLERVHSEDRERFIRELEKLEEGIYHDMQYRVVRPDGSERLVRDRAFPVHNAKGEVYRVAGIIQDVTEMHQANAALRESESRFRSIFEYAAAGMATGTPDGRISEVNDALARMLGYTPEELTGKTIREITHPDDWSDNKQMLEAVKATQRSTYQLQKRYRKKDGSALWVQLSSAWIRDDDEQPLYWIALQQDINQQKQAEKLLHEQLTERASLLNASPVGIGLVRNRKIQWLNQRFLDMLGYAEEELLQRNSRCVYPSDEEYERVGREKYAQIEATGVGEIETVMCHRDGHTLNVLLRSVPLDESNISAGTIFTALDITQRKQAEEELHLFRNLFDQTKDAFFVVDAETAEIVNFNLEACRSLGYSREELSSLRIPDITDLFETGLQAWRKFLERFEPTGELIFETRHIHKDGNPFPVEITARLIDYQEKSYLVGVVRDITETLKARQALLDKNRELETLLNTIPSPVYFEDRELRYQMVNRAFLDFMDRSEEHVLGKTNVAFFPPDVAEAFMDVDGVVIGQGRQVTDHEQRVPSPDGQFHWFSTTKTPLIDSAGEVVGLVGISTDITPLKELAEQRLNKEQILREALVREVHHRIKNHLQGVVGMLHNLTYSCTDISRCMEKAITQVRTIATVYGLYTQAGTERLQIGELVQACINIYTSDEVAQIDFQADDFTAVNLARKESVPVALVINELIANALKHSKGSAKGGDIKVSLSAHGQQVRFCLINSGKLPVGFDFSTGRETGTGLELLRTLLPPEGAHLDIRQEDGRVIAELMLESPLIGLVG